MKPWASCLCLAARAALQPLKDPKRELSDEERRGLVHLVDHILGVAAEGSVPQAGQGEQSPALGVTTLHRREAEAPPIAK